MDKDEIAALRLALIDAARWLEATESVLRREETDLQVRLGELEVAATEDVSLVEELASTVTLVAAWPDYARGTLSKARQQLDEAAAALTVALVEAE